MKIHSALLTLALFGVCSTVFAQWQWVDSDGRKVFSDRAPPSDVLDKNILKRPNAAVRAAPAAAPAGNAQNTTAPATAAVPATALTALDKELLAKKKQAEEFEVAKRKADEERIAKAKIENCARAKQAKANLDSGLRISRTNASGEREVLDDIARANERTQIQGILESDCR